MRNELFFGSLKLKNLKVTHLNEEESATTCGGANVQDGSQEQRIDFDKNKKNGLENPLSNTWSIPHRD